MQSSGLEALWPGNAIVLAILILAGRNRRDIVAIVAGGAAGSVLLHLLYRDPISILVSLTAANVVESGLAFILLRILGIRGGLVDRVGNYFALVAAAAATGLVSSTIGGLGLWIGRDIPFWDGWRSWYLSGVLSAVMVTPSVIVAVDLIRGHGRRAPNGRSIFEFIGLSSMVGAVAAFVFLHHGLPLTFIVSPSVLLLTFRVRAIGAVAGVAIVTTIAASATASGYGSIALLLRHQPGDQVLLLQAFIATNLLSALPVAAVLNERDYQADETRAFAEHFKSVVENIGEVIFRIDGQGRWAYLNPAWETLTGQPIAATLGRSWLDLVEPSARPGLPRTAQPTH